MKNVELYLPVFQKCSIEILKMLFCFWSGSRCSHYCGYCFLLPVALQQLLPLVQVVSNTERSSVEADTHQEHNIKIYNLKKNCVAVESYNDKYCVFFSSSLCSLCFTHMLYKHNPIWIFHIIIHCIIKAFQCDTWNRIRRHPGCIKRQHLGL